MKEIINKKIPGFVKKYWIEITIFLLGVSVSFPLLRSGYFSHQDDLQIMRIFEMRKCFADLQIPCRWVPDMGWGNGFPLFNFYGVFTYYIGGVLSLFIGFINASKLLFMIALIAGSFGINLLVKDLWGKYAGLTAAVLYIFAPYKALDIYVRGALSESMALAIIPFALYFGYKLITDYGKEGEKASKMNIVGFVLSVFFFLITHNIMTVIFLPVLMAWLFYWLISTSFKSTKLVIATLIFTFGLSAFFIIPAFMEKDLVQTESLTRFELDFRANFVGLRQLFFDRTWGYGTSIPGPEGGMSFQIGWPYWIIVFTSIAFCLYRILRKKFDFVAWGIIAAFMLSIFMTHNKSSFIWERIHILTFFQFPWRFLSLSILTSSLLGGFVIYVLQEKYRKYLAVSIITITVLLNWSYFKPREYYKVNDQQKLSDDLWEQQRKGAMLDYLPKTALEPREGAPELPLVISGEAVVSNFINKTNSFKFDAKVTKTSQIDVPVYYFPNWEVKVDGMKFNSNHDNLLGRISVTLDEGEHIVVGKFKNTPLRTLGNAISLISIIIFIGFIKWKKYKSL